VGIYRVRPDGTFLEANAVLAAMLGVGGAEELKRLNAADFFADEAERQARLVQIERKAPDHQDYRLHAADGRSLWVRDFARVVRGADGKVRWIDGAILDITADKKAEEELRKTSMEYRRLFERAHDAVMIFALEGEIILDVNDSACRLYGFDRKELVGMSLERLSKDVAYGKQRLARLVEGDEERTFETTHFRKDGGELRLEVNATLVTFAGQRAVMSINRDITERERRMRDLHRQALTDPLTGVANRILLEDHLGLAMAQASHTGMPLAVLFIDLDGFKEVNDNFGHAAGDEVLRAIASRLTTALRRGDTVARHGGDEFVAVLPELSSKEDAAEVAAKLLAAIRAPVPTHAGEQHVSASIGVAMYPDSGSGAADLIAAADLAMYDAKLAGKDTFRMAAPASGT
jgi:diguanylate cyclase (GGDEF)-like protein/PAS domain S-box-containing protein